MSALDIESFDDVPVARPREDIDAATAGRLHAQLAASMSDARDRLVLDLGETGFVDSAGVDMLLRLNERLRQRRSQLLLVIPAGSHLARLAEIVALPSQIPVHETVEDALASL